MNNRAKMPPLQRAKQFAPFDALTGLRIALKEKEKIRVPKKIISEDKAEEINRILLSMKIGDEITAIYYDDSQEQYICLS
ncbi:MAG: YolD-like family protein, partial [Clostridia bacterium]|nr:YolD-like family protein [Clostridia bacterium]